MLALVKRVGRIIKDPLFDERIRTRVGDGGSICAGNESPTHAAIADLSPSEGMGAFKITILSASMTTRTRNKRLSVGLIVDDGGIRCLTLDFTNPNGFAAAWAAWSESLRRWWQKYPPE